MGDKSKYLNMLAGEYPNIAAASAGIIKLKSKLHLPKGTEHFLSDLHGEHEAFFHVIKNASGAVKRKIDDALGDSISESDKKELATVIYYPKEKLELINKVGGLSEREYEDLIRRLIAICKQSIAKYSREDVRRFIPQEYSYIIEELIDEDAQKLKLLHKGDYYNEIISSIIELGRADDFICALSELIHRTVIARLHIVGDIYDRGPGPHFIMDFLENYHSFDVQWGNHDVVWMGAALGHGACICNIIRSSLRYDELDIFNDGYGINMIPLMQFAKAHYEDDPCECYAIKGRKISYDSDTQLTMKMHKAISIIQWKLEGQIIMENPEYHMDDRLLLDKIDFETGTVHTEGRDILLKDTLYPTIDPNAPYELTAAEADLMNKLSLSFVNCAKLQRHAELLLTNGALYLASNGNLLFHACVPLNEDGTLREVELYGKKYHGKKLYEALEIYVRKGFASDDEADRQRGADILWYLWNAPDSPLFGKHRMATFERYLLDDKDAKKEIKDPYFKLINDENIAKMILEEFGADPENGIIVNGHVPVKQSSGESPIKAGGKVFVIDGGLSKAYQKETGIAGYTLVYNSMGKILTAHKPFTSAQDAVLYGDDIVSEDVAKSNEIDRVFIKDTDEGNEIRNKISDLQELIDAFKSGELKEKC